MRRWALNALYQRLLDVADADMTHRAVRAAGQLHARVRRWLVEGNHTAEGAEKIEVWRAATGTAPIASERGDIRAVITDDPLETGAPIWPRADVPAIADRILEP